MTAGNIVWLDYNNAPEQRLETAADTQALRHGLLDRLESVLLYLFPSGRIRGNKFYVGDIDGAPGKSLVVELDGPRRGLWKDFADDDGGDLIAAWAKSRGLSTQQDFPRIADEIRQWLGFAPPVDHGARRDMRTVPMDELGPYTAKWDYVGLDGELIVGSPTSKTCYNESASGVMRQDGAPAWRLGAVRPARMERRSNQ